MTTPTPIETRKNTVSDEYSAQACTGTGVEKPRRRVSTTIPMTSSITAALTIVVPRKPLQLPQLLQGGHRDETLVAVMIVPMKSARNLGRRSPPGQRRHRQQCAAYQRYKHAVMQATSVAMGPAAQQLFQVGAKAGGEHQQLSTPISAVPDCVADLHEVQQAGPRADRARIYRTTWGALHLRATRPQILALKIIMAKLLKYGIHEKYIPFNLFSICFITNECVLVSAKLAIFKFVL